MAIPAAMGGPVGGILKRLADLPDNTREPRPYHILAIVCLANFLDMANLSAVTIALPTIGQQLNSDQSQLQWVITAYALTFGSFLLVGGRGGDIFGYRRVLLVGSSLFALFTLVCALAPTFPALVLGRAFQGIGAGFTIPSAQAHVAIYFPEPKARAQALGLWAASASIGFTVGLILGGVLVAMLSWRWIFWVSLIVSGVAVPVSYILLPRVAPAAPLAATADSALHGGDTEKLKRLFHAVRTRMVRFDVLGTCLGVSGLLLLSYALSSGNTSGWASAPILSTLFLAVVLLVLFAFQESRASQAFLSPSLFYSMSFNLTLVVAVVTYAVRQACTYFLTLQLQSYGNSPLRTALLFLPIGVASLSNSVAGRLVPLLGARVMFALGWALLIPGVLLFSFITPSSSYWCSIFPGMVLYIVGIQPIYVTANFIVLSSASRNNQGSVLGLFNVALQVGGSVLGLAVLTAVADGVNDRFGDDSSQLSEIGYKSVYYSCLVLCCIALLLCQFAIQIPEAVRGTVWKRKQGTATGPTELHSRGERANFE